jgi:hypothetical protein
VVVVVAAAAAAAAAALMVVDDKLWTHETDLPMYELRAKNM